MVFTTSGELVGIDESAQSSAIANDLLNKMKLVRKQINSIGTGESFSKSSYLKTWSSVKFFINSAMNFCSLGVKSAAINDTIWRLGRRNLIRNATSGPIMTKSAFIRNVIQFLVSILLKFLGKKIRDTNEKDIVRTSKSVVEDLKRMKENAKDEKLIEYLDRQIDTLEDKIKDYEVEVNKK